MTTAPTHTPGPWVLANRRDGGFSVYSGRPGVGRYYVICARSSIPHRAAQSAANARLIAAAPDLLAKAVLLVASLDFCKLNPQQSVAFIDMEFAIADATGAA